MRSKRRSTKRKAYDDYDRSVLLTGLTLSGLGRFGDHKRAGWDRAAIQLAWDELGDELTEQCDGVPFAVRYLAQDSEHYWAKG